jgi:aminoglycoside phosphotransferase (APT) family kinase protein
VILTAANVFYYLLDRGLTTAETVVDGDFRIATLSRRNQAFRVNFRARPGYVLKQPGDWHPINIRTFEFEAHWYWLARNHPGFAPVARFLSTCPGYDAENQILILDVPGQCEDLDRHQRRLGRYPVDIAQLLGEKLAAFHTALPAGARAELRSDFRQVTPWILSLSRSTEASLDRPSQGVMDLVGIVQGDPGFEKGFAELRDLWRTETFINGDMKFAHCIRNGDGLYFIDWEMADFGDPLWDVGAIFQEYLGAWLRSMPPSPGVPLPDLVRRARRPLDQIQPAIRAFWQAYRDRAGGQPPDALDRAAGYAAGWLIQAAYQHLKESESISTHAVRLAQLARNILGDRGAAVQGLLGC